MPGPVRLGSLLLLRPLKMHRLFRAWGLEQDPMPLALLPRLLKGDPIAGSLLTSWAFMQLLVAPAVTVLFAMIAEVAGIPLALRGVALGILLGAGLGALLSLSGVGAGVAAYAVGEVSFGVVMGASEGPTPPDLLFVAVSASFGMAVGAAAGVTRGVAAGEPLGLPRGVLLLLAVGVLAGVYSALTAARTDVLAAGLAGGVAASAAALLFMFQLPLWPLEALFTLLISWIALLRPHAAPWLSSLLPVRHHDLIYLPLPGLRTFLIQLGAQDPALVRELLREPAFSLGQKRRAQLALAELQARDLERAATGRLFARAAKLDFPFLPSAEGLSADSPFSAFESAARDLSAGGSSHHQRRLALARAHGTLTDFITAVGFNRRSDDVSGRLVQTARLWLDIIQDEQHNLSREEATNPQVPTAFVAGPALTPDRPEEQSLFKGRQDLIQLIDHDLAPDRRGALLVFGQRRMGKTSLRNFLPHVLGTGTLIVAADFQALSGYEHRETPHRRVLELLAAKLPGAPPLPDTPRWGEGLRWLQWVDTSMGNKRLLVVIDEVERVEDGIREGWCSTDFLDFLRAAGDSLRHIRFLLLTAYPLHRLGPHWVDKLVSATSRTISYLDEVSAEELIRRPVPDFPDIYPEGGVDRILHETRRHPFLVQKVCDELCRLLNERGGRRRATGDELTEVLDRVLAQVDLFDELWRQRTPAERDALRRLAAAPGPSDADPVTRQLAREGYVEKRGDKVTIAVPLFRAWIAETQGPEDAG